MNKSYSVKVYGSAFGRSLNRKRIPSLIRLLEWSTLASALLYSSDNKRADYKELYIVSDGFF